MWRMEEKVLVGEKLLQNKQGVAGPQLLLWFPNLLFSLPLFLQLQLPSLNLHPRILEFKKGP